MLIKSDGTLWGWGDSYSGQVGDISFNEYHSPIQVGKDRNWVEVASGGSHSVAIKSDGTMWSWGFNGYGQLGIGSIVSKFRPTQVGKDSTWYKAACGGRHTMAIKTDGTLWAWGLNSSGQVGDKSYVDARYPVLVSDKRIWKYINCGFESSFALNTEYIYSVERKLDTEYLSIYPNPADSNVNLKITANYGDKIKIKDLFVKEIINLKLNRLYKNENFKLDINSLNSGIYFVELESNETIFFNKLIVTR